MNLRRWLWTAIGGFVIGIPGMVWAKLWHSRNPGEDIAGVTQYLEGHGLMILGVLIVFITLAAAAGSVRGRSRSAVLSTWLAFAGSMLIVAGFVWDTVRHFQATESPTPSAMIAMLYGGLVLTVVGIPAALRLSRVPAPTVTR